MIQTYLDELVPARGDNDRVLGVRAEADARNPLGVALVSNGVLAVAQGVPELNGPIARSGDDLTIVGREGDRKNVIGVADESPGGGACSELPQTKGLVPRGRQSVSTVGGDHLDEAESVQVRCQMRACSRQRREPRGTNVQL